MRKVFSDTRAPGGCFICLGNPIPSGGYLLETGSRNDPGIITDRTGEIYVCSNCAESIAKEAGFVHENDVSALRADAAAARADRAKAHELLDEVQALLHKARPRAAQEA